ncbi:MAG: hypothetical protein IPN67_13435 [Bacteroidales bacterium]|nr:hypothetical protein [Bacteroidales bacterium]
MTFESSELTILPRPVTITANPRTKVYGDPDNLTYRITSGTLAGSDAFTGFLSRVNGENVGSYSIMQGTLAVNSNYAVTFIGANLTIVPRNISVTADSRTKKYGETDPEFTYRITSGSLVSKGDAVSGVLSREAGEDVGVYAIRQGTLFISNNYRISFVGASLTIESAFLTIVADFQSKSFGDPDPELTFKVTSGSLVGTDTITGRLLRDDGEDVGEYSINQGSLQLNTNYTLVFSGATFKITPRPVTVMAVARKKVFGESDPELIYRITSGNLVGSDSFTGGLIRDAGEDVGTYAISQGDLALRSNYDLTFIGANFRITAEFEMKAYPNPFSDHIVFELELNNSADISIVLYSFTGIKLATVFSGNVEPGFYTFEYRPHNIIKGFLIYQLFIDGKEIVDGKAIHQ